MGKCDGEENMIEKMLRQELFSLGNFLCKI